MVLQGLEKNKLQYLIGDADYAYINYNTDYILYGTSGRCGSNLAVSPDKTKLIAYTLTGETSYTFTIGTTEYTGYSMSLNYELYYRDKTTNQWDIVYTGSATVKPESNSYYSSVKFTPCLYGMSDTHAVFGYYCQYAIVDLLTGEVDAGYSSSWYAASAPYIVGALPINNNHYTPGAVNYSSTSTVITLVDKSGSYVTLTAAQLMGWSSVYSFSLWSAPVFTENYIYMLVSVSMSKGGGYAKYLIAINTEDLSTDFDIIDSNLVLTRPSLAPLGYDCVLLCDNYSDIGYIYYGAKQIGSWNKMINYFELKKYDDKIRLIEMVGNLRFGVYTIIPEIQNSLDGITYEVVDDIEVPECRYFLYRPEEYYNVSAAATMRQLFDAAIISGYATVNGISYVGVYLWYNLGIRIYTVYYAEYSEPRYVSYVYYINPKLI